VLLALVKPKITTSADETRVTEPLVLRNRRQFGNKTVGVEAYPKIQPAVSTETLEESGLPQSQPSQRSILSP
jgi:hypothetical protein